MNHKNQGQQGRNRRLFQPSQRSPERSHYPGIMNTSRWDDDVDTDVGFMGSSDYREMNPYGDYETNDRNRQPSKKASFDRPTSGFDRNLNRGQSRWAGTNDHLTWGTSDRSYGHSYGEGSLDHERDTQYGPSEGTSHASGFFGKGPKGYKRSDERIREEVCETLSRHPRIDASDIEVKVEDACVTLSGGVESREMKRAAEMAIENISGVDDVKNELRMKKADDSIYASSAGAKNMSMNSKSTSSTKGTNHL